MNEYCTFGGKQNNSFMKKNKFSLLLLFSLILHISCENSNEDDLIEIIEQGPDPIAYINDIKNIVDTNCTPCHNDPQVNGAPMPLLTYDQVKQAVQQRGLLNRITSTSAPMPPTGNLPSSVTGLIQQWADEGLLEDNN